MSHSDEDGKIIQKRKNQIRDKNAPKLPMNAYSAFYKQNFGSFQATYKNRNETNAMLAKKWSEMLELEKKPYLDNYAEERRRYEAELEEYRKSDQYKEFMSKVIKKSNQNLNLIETRVGYEQKKSSARVERGRQQQAEKFSRKFPSSPPVEKKMKVFSDEFLRYNKEQDQIYKQLRRDVKDLQDEVGRIEEANDQFEERLNSIQDELYNEETKVAFITGVSERLRQSVLNSLNGTKLLGQLDLKESCSAEQIVQSLQEIQEKNIERQIRNCFDEINYSNLKSFSLSSIK